MDIKLQETLSTILAQDCGGNSYFNDAMSELYARFDTGSSASRQHYIDTGRYLLVEEELESFPQVDGFLTILDQRLSDGICLTVVNPGADPVDILVREVETDDGNVGTLSGFGFDPEHQPFADWVVPGVTVEVTAATIVRYI